MNKIYYVYIFVIVMMISMSSAVLNDNDVINYYGFQAGNTTHFYDSARNITFVKAATGGNISGYNANLYLNASKYWANGDVFIFSKNVSSTTPNMTVSFWFNITSTSAGAGDIIDFVAGAYEFVFTTNTIAGACTGGVTAGTLSLCRYTGSWVQTLNIGNYTLSGVNQITFVFKYISTTATNVSMYVNGNSTFNYTMPIPSGSAIYRMDMRRGAGVPTGYMDEISIWNDSLSDTQIKELYNNGTVKVYPYFNASSVTVDRSYYVNTSQVPVDINSSIIGFTRINASAVNVSSNNTINGSSYMELYYNITTALGTCAIFENQQCTDGMTHVVNMTKITNSTFTTSLAEAAIFPAYYPFYQSYIENENTTDYNYTVYKNNNILFRILNFTTYTNPFISMEMNANNNSGSSIMSVYYCNSSYTTGNPAVNGNCQVIQTIPASGFTSSHCHNSRTCHYVFNVNINTVQKTQLSYIIVISTENLPINGYNVKYVLNSSYNNNSFMIGQYNSWSTTTDIFDMHIHQFTGNDSLSYKTIFNDGTGFKNQSSIVVDYFDIVNQPPTAVLVFRPNETDKPTVTTLQNTTIYFDWTDSTDFENATIIYNLSVLNALNLRYFIADGITQNHSWYNWSTNANVIPAGWYTAQVKSCDTSNKCSVGSSQGPFYICQNVWHKSVQPCNIDSRLILYVDNASCDAQYGLPTDNGTYESCTLPPTTISFTVEPTLLILLILFVIYLSSLLIGMIYDKMILVLSGCIFIAITLVAVLTFIPTGNASGLLKIFTISAGILIGLMHMLYGATQR